LFVTSSDRFELPLPAEHRFPIRKYRLLREAVESDGLFVSTPRASTEAELVRVHTPQYVRAVRDGTLSPLEFRRIGFPWSPQMVERSRRSTGATVETARAALRDGIAVHLAGGTHHAFADRGEGYCVFNDVSVAIRVVQAEQLASRALVIDADVHQGNGTASIHANDSSVFTFSIHGEQNFPFAKETSDLDIPLPRGTRDDAYLEALGRGMDTCFARFEPDIAFYVAGADPYEGDRLGHLAVTVAGLARRDTAVIDTCRARSLPVAVVMGGGYARDEHRIVEIHRQTVRIARDRSGRDPSATSRA
jgi:acetoin utilization deacetylase AcuC-like enzyme